METETTHPATSHTGTLGERPPFPVLLVLGMILRGLLGWELQPIAELGLTNSEQL